MVKNRTRSADLKARDEVAWNLMLEQLREVAEADGGVAHVPQGDTLGWWCMHQARADPHPTKVV